MEQQLTVDQLKQEGAQDAQRKGAGVVSLDETHIDDLCREIVEKGASDLHICTGVPPILRIDGDLVPCNYGKFNAMQTQRMLYEILSDEQIQRFEDTWELDFSYSLQNLARFRVNIFKDKNTVAAAFRLIPIKIPTIKELGLPPVLESISKYRRGLVSVSYTHLTLPTIYSV